MYLTGVLQAIGVVIISAFFNVYVMFWTQNYTIHPIIFSLFCILATSWTMLVVSGPGRFAKNTTFNFATWLQGFSLVANMVLAVYLIQYISGVEVAILRRLSVPVSIILAYIIFKRKAHTADYISFFVLLCSACTVLYLQNDNTIIIVLLTLLAAFMQCTSFMLTETHKQSAQAHVNGDIRDRGRVVGMSAFITSSIFLVFIVMLSTLNHYLPVLKISTIVPFTPMLTDFLGSASIISGVLFGLFFSPFLRYFIWSANYKIKSENVLTILALIPLATFIFEYIGFSTGIIISSVFTGDNFNLIFILCIFMIILSLYSTYKKGFLNVKAFFNSTDKQLLLARTSAFRHDSSADYEIIKNTIDFYEGDIIKASRVLNLPVNVVRTLYTEKNAYYLRDDISKKVHEIFRNKIFYLDQLTGVENKKGLIRQFAEYQEQGVKFNLYYMDINKFKSINDTYGHDIGDVAIITTVHRIRDYTEQNEGFAYRLGGDEFAMMTISEKSEQQVISEIKNIVSQPIDYNENGKKGTLNPTISIGRANIIKDEDVKIAELIKSADENMYKDKENK